MATAKMTVTPVLSSKVGYLEDIRDQIMTIFRFVIYNPGRISNLWEDKLISFRKLAAELEADRDVLVDHLESKIIRALTRMFANYTFEGDFKTEDYKEGNEDGRYKVIFNLFFTKSSDTVEMDTERKAGVISGSIAINPTTNSIVLNYDRSIETQGLM